MFEKFPYTIGFNPVIFKFIVVFYYFVYFFISFIFVPLESALTAFYSLSYSLYRINCMIFL